MRDMILICDKWEFCKCSPGTVYGEVKNWSEVDLPHDWLIYDTNDLYENSTGWYRRTVDIPDDGRRTALRFDGVYMDCRIYVNGVQAFEWKYGYTSFECDITKYLHTGKNLVAVRVDHIEPNSRWYSGAGIYRKVRLVRYENTHILSDGVYISADTDGNVTVVTQTERPDDKSCEKLCLKAVITKYGSDETVAESTAKVCACDRSALPGEIVRDSFKYSKNEQKLFVCEPELWDIEKPELYECRVSLFDEDRQIDSVSVRFGFRSAVMTSDKGFFLNSRHVKLHGVCEHHDLGALGAAVNKCAIERKLRTLRSIGVNAIRTSHNPPAPEFLEAADEMGFLIIDEFLDMWELKKTENDYARFFGDWVRRDAASWIRRDRNHPSVIGWSIGNEIYDTHISERGQEVTSLLKGLVELHDPKANGFVTIGSNYMASDNAQRCADILKNAGYNYAERLYEEHHRAHPDWNIYGSETSSIVQSRGIYHFPADKDILCEDDEQCSALGNSSPAWASKSWEHNLISDRDAEFCAGQFIWTGFDYIGEPTPYSTKNSYFGQIDTAGFLKDSAYVYKAVWTDSRKDPFVHIFPYWDFNEGEMIDVLVTTNCFEAKLYFNGEELASKVFGDRPMQLTMKKTLPYSKGELVAIAYDENGNELARDVQRSFSETAEIRLLPDRQSIACGSEELIFVEISAYDSDGNFVANGRDRVFVDVSGAGRLVGLDNGDSTDYEQYKGTSRRLFSGRLLAMIAPVEKAGDIIVRVTSPGLPEKTLTLRADESKAIEGISFTARNTERRLDCDEKENDISPRRIALRADETVFGPERKKLRINYKVLPESSPYKDVEFRIATYDGIDCGYARITQKDENSVTVEALGDGEFYLRAVSRCGTKKIRLISMLRLSAQGLGSALSDPYSFVTGGLYTISGGNVTNGIQHGAGISEGGGWVGFENVDFGEVGSDTITIPLFANYATPVGIKVYDGVPGEGGELIGDFVYDLKPIWLTYQAMTYKLNRLLRGIHTIVLASDVSYNIQGFVFEKRAKETAELTSVHAESIYGDRFKRSDDEITGIGNNVMISFGTFDFCDKAPKRIYIKGRSALPVNSIHLQFTDENAEQKRILCEFEQADDYTERAFTIEGISGKVVFSMIFLPGSDFDLRSVRFE